jgi:hypothetical protein
MEQLTLLENKLNSFDISVIVEYKRKINDLANIKKIEAPAYLRDFIIAYDVTSILFAKSIEYELEAKTLLEYAEAIAYLDKATEYLNSKSIKETNEARKQYVNIDVDVIKAKGLKGRTEAIVVLLKNKLIEFRLAHDDVKKITYDEPYQTPYEGM